VRAFWRRVERYSPGAQVAVEAVRGVERQLAVVTGWACELRILPDGRRQIFGFLLPGDFIDGRATSSLGHRGVVAITRLEVVNASPHLADPVARADLLGALDEAVLQKEERLYDHLTRIGRLTARERVLHLLLEFCDRLEQIGLAKADSFKLPLTQEIFADTLGLSVVHINRTLKQLRQEGAVMVKAGTVTLHNRARLAAAVGYRAAARNDAARADMYGAAGVPALRTAQ
jgi:CRP-like cAMP-binding protein